MLDRNFTAQDALKQRDEQKLKERKEVWLKAYRAAIPVLGRELVCVSRNFAKEWADAALEDFEEKFNK